LATGGRNTLPFDPINNIDFALSKRVNIAEHKAVHLGIQAFNLFSHPQFTGGYLSDVAASDTHSSRAARTSAGTTCISRATPGRCRSPRSSRSEHSQGRIRSRPGHLIETTKAVLLLRALDPDRNTEYTAAYSNPPGLDLSRLPV
jgi:hypothetical protein